MTGVKSAVGMLVDDINATDAVEVVKTYPSVADGDGWFFESEDDEADGVATSATGDGNGVVKRIVLKNGKVAVIRELTTKDVLEARQIAGAGSKKGVDPKRVELAMLEVSTTVDGKRLFMSDAEKLRSNDFIKLSTINAALNFS